MNNKNILSLFSIVVSFSVTSQALRCKSGSTASSFLYSVKHWKEKECESALQRCVRVEAEFSIMNNYLTVRSASGSCITASDCSNECKKVFKALLKEGAKSGVSLPVDITAIPMEIRKCDMDCCNDEFCNRNSVKKIRNIKSQQSSLFSTRRSHSASLLSTALTTTPDTKQSMTKQADFIPITSTKSRHNQDDEVVIIPSIRTVKTVEQSLEYETLNNSQRFKKLLKASLVTASSLQKDSPTQNAVIIKIEQLFVGLSLLVCLLIQYCLL